MRYVQSLIDMQIFLFVAKRPFGVIMLPPTHGEIAPSQETTSFLSNPCQFTRGCLKAIWVGGKKDMTKTWCQGAWMGTLLGIWFCHDTHLLQLKAIIKNRLGERWAPWITSHYHNQIPNLFLLKATIRRWCLQGSKGSNTVCNKPSNGVPSLPSKT